MSFSFHTYYWNQLLLRLTICYPSAPTGIGYIRKYTICFKKTSLFVTLKHDQPCGQFESRWRFLKIPSHSFVSDLLTSLYKPEIGQLVDSSKCRLNLSCNSLPINFSMAYDVLEMIYRHRGMVYAFVSGVIWGFNGLGIALTVQTVSPCVLSYFFFLFHLVGLPFINWSLDEIYNTKLTLLVFLSSLLDPILVLACIFAYDFINFGNASALLYSKTIFCGVLAWFFLRERFTKFDCMLLCVHFVGVILVTKPSFLFKYTSDGDWRSNVVGCVLGLSGALSSSLEFITVRYLVEESALDMALLFIIKCFIGMFSTGLLSYFTISSHRYIRTLPELGYVLFTCVSGFVAYAFNVIALRTENAKTVAAILSVEVIVAFLLQVSFTDQQTDISSVSGASLILLVLVAYCIEGIYYQSRLLA